MPSSSPPPTDAANAQAASADIDATPDATDLEATGPTYAIAEAEAATEIDAATPAAPAEAAAAASPISAAANANAPPLAQDGAAPPPQAAEPQAPLVAYAALTDVEQALTLRPDDPEALRIRADIYRAMGRTDEAIADYHRALELDPFQFESREALVKLNQEVPAEQGQPLAPPVSDWVIKEPSPGRYIARNPKYPKVQAELEMFGAGEPKILEWNEMKDSLAGIGLLRYYAGDLGEGAAQDLVYTAIVDLWAQKVVSIEPYSWGSNGANWSWQARSVVVTDPNGYANEIKLRKFKPRPVARRGSRYSGQGRGSVGRGRSSRWQAPGLARGRRGGGGGFFGWFSR